MKKLAILFSLLCITTLARSQECSCTVTDSLPDPTDAAALKNDGFKAIFNGKDLTGWKKIGGTGKFEVKDGAVRGYGEQIKGNTFLRTEKTYGDFILIVQMKMVDRNGNSGLQFRSNQRDGKGRVFGYQCEHDNFKNGRRAWTAGVFDEARRKWLYPGKFGLNNNEAKKAFTDQGVRLFKWDDWNTIVIRCQGRHIQTWLNGEKRADFYDMDTEHFTPEGFFALQVHSGKSGDILWRNIYLKEL